MKLFFGLLKGFLLPVKIFFEDVTVMFNKGSPNGAVVDKVLGQGRFSVHYNA